MFLGDPGRWVELVVCSAQQTSSVRTGVFLSFNSNGLNNFPLRTSSETFDVNENHCSDSTSRKSESDCKLLKVNSDPEQSIHNHWFNERSVYKESYFLHIF